MLVRPQALADSPTRALALFALVPLFALSVFAADLSDAAGAGSILWPLILAILGTVALAAGVRVDHERGPLNAALLISQSAGLDLHIEKRYGKSPHHVVEAAFKGAARALRDAVAIDPRETGLPTVKGAL